MLPVPPSIAFFCATFLKPEMLHIHRHLSGLKSFRPIVIAQKREGQWPVDRIEIVKRSPGRFLARATEKRSGRPWQISAAETERMLAIVERENCTLLHVFFGNVAVHLLPLLRRSPIPLVISFHGSDVAGSMASRDYSSAREELFALATVVPCRSEELAAKVVKLGCPESKTRLMRTLLPDIPFVDRQPPRDGTWRIVQAARLVPKKGLSSALRAFATFAVRFPAATFMVAGDGPLAGELRKLATELGVSDRVQFLGFLSQSALQNLFVGSHVFLQPSEIVAGDTEGIPNAMLEAMASGLPVIATRHGGIPEVIDHERNGLLCEERDFEALSLALSRLALDPLLYRRIGRNAFLSIREQFSQNRQITAIEEIYRKAIEAHSPLSREKIRVQA